MDIPTLLKTARRHAGLSQRQLAARSGTCAAAVCQYERGDRLPRADTLSRLVSAAGATLRLDVEWPPAAIDVAESARTLEELLDLADHLPQRSGPVLSYPPFRSIAA